MPGESLACAQYDLDWLLAPITPKRFYEDYWDQAPLYVEGRTGDHYSSLYSLAAFDHALSHNGIRSPFLRLVQEGYEIPLNQLADQGAGRANLLEDVYGEFRRGASIVLQFLHEQNPAIKLLSTALAEALSCYVQVNAYLTPQGERGLGTHFDTHDVFVLQIHGHKNWTLFERTQHVPFKRERGSRTEVQNAVPTQTLTLSPGDCLYLPRGWVHQAESRESSSLHLTVGVHPQRWGDVLLSAITELIKEDPRYRAAFPPGFAASAEGQAEALRTLEELRSALMQDIDPQDILTRATAAAQHNLPPQLEGHLLDLTTLDQISPHTKLRCRSIRGLALQQDSETVRIAFHGKTVECPSALAPALQFILDHSTFCVRELPDFLSDQDKVLLSRRLVQEGLLTHAT